MENEGFGFTAARDNQPAYAEPQIPHSARNIEKQPSQTLQPSFSAKQISNVAQFKNSKLFQKFMQKEQSKQTITPLNAAAMPPKEF